MTKRIFPALLCGILALTACSSSKPTATGSLSGSPSASASASAPSPGGSPSPQSLSSTLKAKAPADATAKPGARPAKASQSTPTAPGIYIYDQEGTGSGGGQSFTLPKTGTLRVEKASKVSNGMRSKQTRKLSDKFESEAVLVFSSSKIQLTEVSAQGFSCVLQPALEAIRLPVTVGESWKDEAACTTGGQTISVKMEASVTKTQNVTIGKTTLKTYVMHVVTTLSSGPTFSQTQTQDIWLSPEYRLAVKSTTHVESVSPFGNGTADYSDRLRSLAPAPLS